MKITPLEIRQKTFEKAFRGLDKEEVQAFLLTLSQQWEKLQDENKDLRVKLEVAGREVQKLREVESSLYKTLKTAEDTSTSIVEQASKAADLQVREAQLKADQVLESARQKARSVLESAYMQADKTVAEMHAEVKSLEQDYLRLEDYLENMVRDLQNLASDALDKVEKTRSKPKASLASILQRAAQIKAQRPDDEKDTAMNAFASTPIPAVTPTPKQANVPVSAFVDQPQADGYEIGGGGSRESIPATPGTIPPVHTPNPAPDVHPRTPEIVPPHIPTPSIDPPRREEPKPDIPPAPSPSPVTEPEPERENPLPEKPEVQPPGTSQAKPAPAVAAGGGSFFDEI
ncbi:MULTISPECIES: DivIVA domain-containing protein [Rufibacter]|uniref:DivIVA domain-containing protein n=1 Tax=Rufibacter TaxID=1379908 RepID=UPI001B30F218|nr:MULTISPECIES: DivIVA domain-containing protein [Rufibacter]